MSRMTIRSSFVLFLVIALLHTTLYSPSFAEGSYKCSVCTNTELTQEGQSVAIIGGGIAGVAAASFLAHSPVQVHLLEAQPVLGGNAQSITVKNAHGKDVNVDIGPQYLADGPWDIYMDFLKWHGLYNKEEFPSFSGSATISEMGKTPYFVTPTLDLSKLSYQFIHNSRYLWVFYRLNELANSLYNGDRLGYYMTIEQFLDANFPDPIADQETLLLPFIASVVGVNVDQARKLSALFVAKLFAFNGPLQSKSFKVSLRGMGNLIQDVGKKLEKEASNVHITKNAHVETVTHQADGYHIEYVQDAKAKELVVDKVITATHPDQVTRFMGDLLPQDVKNSLKSLEYFHVRIVLHKSNRFNKGDLASLYNIDLDDDGNPNTTMQLDQIDKGHYLGINKTWATDEVYNQLKEEGAILAETPFQHPFVTPKFIIQLTKVHRRLAEKDFDSCAMAGGWLEPAETQATSIYSAYKAVNRLFPSWTKQAPWRNHFLRSLSKPGNVYFSQPY